MRNKNLLKCFLKLWIIYTEESRIDREVRNRAAATWQKVQGWIREEKC